MKIALATILKDEIKFIKSYLEQNKNVDYICLLDTGSVDGSWEYLQEQLQFYPNLIINQIIYDNFKYDIAKNDCWKLLPDDVDIVISLDIDEKFSDSNWVEIMKDNMEIDGKRHLYSVPFLDYSTYAITDYPRMCVTASRIFQTKKFKWYHCVHEVISDDDWEYFGTRPENTINWNKLLIIHQPDKTRDRQSYIDLCLERIDEIIPLKYNIEFEKVWSRDLLFFEYYRNKLYEEAENIYITYLAQDDLFQFDSAPCMYKMTGNIQYLRNAIDKLSTKWYEQHLLYYALKDDFDYCKQYKNIILQKIAERDLQVEERFREYDILGNIIKEMANNL